MVPKKFILLTLLAACPVLANTLIVNNVDTSMGMGSLGSGSVWIHEDQAWVQGDTGGSNVQVEWAGAIDITVDSYVRQVFCVQLFTDIGFGTYNTTMDFSDTPNLERLGWLLQNEFPTTALYTAGSDLQLHAAAFQLAFWDIIEDNGDGFAPGAGKITEATDPTDTLPASTPTDSALLDAAIQYETESLGMSSIYGVVYHNTTLGGDPVQNLIGMPPDDSGPSPAPEPATVVMIFAGLALIGLSRLRRGARTN
jgi:hypothetical protein